MNAQDVPPITEDDIAQYLSTHPEFFERYAGTLASVQLYSQHGKRAVSLQERQAEMLREKIKGLERRIMEMVRFGNENMLIADKLQRWTQSLLRAPDAAALPGTVAQEIQGQFQVPQVAIRLWSIRAEFAGEAFASGVSAQAQAMAAALAAPYCGVNTGCDVVQWLPEPQAVQSLALIPLRVDAAAPVCGLLVLASPDAQRFNASMGTEFLERIGELAGAALARLQA